MEPFDDDGNYNYDDPFPAIPLKMDADYIECKNLEDEDTLPYQEFAKGIDKSKTLSVRLDSGVDYRLILHQPKYIVYQEYNFIFNNPF